MKKDDVRKAVISEWLRLPVSDRATQMQAFRWAMAAKERYRWRACGEPYQEVMAWISSYIGKH
jgi:hypothetical protein